jgi:uncharacterized protein with HEPN domain
MPSDPPGRAALAVLEARENIALIRLWAGEADLDALKRDRKTRYAIERAFIAIDAALRDVPPAMLGAANVPIKLISGFRNLLAHTYDDILDERVMLTIRDDLPALDAALETLLNTL